MKNIFNLSCLLVVALLLATSCERKTNPSKNDSNGASGAGGGGEKEEKKKDDKGKKKEEKKGDGKDASVFPVIQATLPGSKPNSDKKTPLAEYSKDQKHILDLFEIAKANYGIRLLGRKKPADEKVEEVTAKNGADFKDGSYGIDETVAGPTVGAALVKMITDKKLKEEEVIKGFAEQAKNLVVALTEFKTRYPKDKSTTVETASKGDEAKATDGAAMAGAMAEALIQPAATPSDKDMLQLSALTEEGLKTILAAAKNVTQEKK